MSNCKSLTQAKARQLVIWRDVREATTVHKSHW